MSALPKHVWTPEEYLTFERASEVKHDFLNGEIYDMTGASRKHNQIVVNLAISLGSQLKGRTCEIYTSDMRVKVNSRHYTYPNAVVVCPEPQFEDRAFDTLLNPTVIIEVLSPSTETYDRTAKLKNYRAIASLMHYILIAQDSAHVEQYSRTGDTTWVISEVDGLDGVIELPAIQGTLSMLDIYDKVTLELEPPNSEA
ncbi:MAG: Uma2 family endonuclease [Chloroflexi bacterium]|nr:Uma2 family endonuclease [Chloroflexota bacterium]